MNDDRMGPQGRPLASKILTNSGRVLRVRAQPVHGFGGKCHELTVAQGLHGSLDLNLGSSDDADHME